MGGGLESCCVGHVYGADFEFCVLKFQHLIACLPYLKNSFAITRKVPPLETRRTALNQSWWQWCTEGGSYSLPPENPKALENRAKFN